MKQATLASLSRQVELATPLLTSLITCLNLVTSRSDSVDHRFLPFAFYLIRSWPVLTDVFSTISVQHHY